MLPERRDGWLRGVRDCHGGAVAMSFSSNILLFVGLFLFSFCVARIIQERKNK